MTRSEIITSALSDLNNCQSDDDRFKVLEKVFKAGSVRYYNPTPTLQSILTEVSIKTDIPESDIKSKSRKGAVVEARHFYFRRCYDLLNNPKQTDVAALVNRQRSDVSVALSKFTRGAEISLKYRELFGGKVGMFKGERLIKIYDSGRDAAEKTGFDSGRIHQSIRIGWKVKGFTFKKI